MNRVLPIIPLQQVIESINKLMGILSQEGKKLDYLVIDGEKVEIEYLTADHPTTQKVRRELKHYSESNSRSTRHTSQLTEES